MDLDRELKRRIRERDTGVGLRDGGIIEIWSPEAKKNLFLWATDAGADAAQGMLAGGLGHELAQWLAREFNSNFDLYDKAIDSIYNNTHIGGSLYHHLIDGHHSIYEAYQAVRDVSPNDSFFRELYEAAEHLFRDMLSVSGINPLFSMSQETFNKISEWLSPLGVSKMYLADALTVNGPEILGGFLSIIPFLIARKKPNKSMMAYLSGSMALCAVASGNPVLLPAAAYGMYKSVKEGEMSWKSLVYHMGKGAIVSGSVIAISSLGAPVWLGITASFATSIAVKAGLTAAEKAWEKVHPNFSNVVQEMPRISSSIRDAYTALPAELPA
ncbi:MAG: hypothetical protein DRH10_07920 [Deltaproteobacteria bacterium]|nr:MAG: hypothetical protein DRH10_07920 [Deltaproteobacteria bacterium]